MEAAIKIDELVPEFKEEVLARIPNANFDLCLTCGTCTGGCPASEQFDMDPRKLIRMLNFGMDDEVKKSNWMWVCSMCARCQSVCPMNIAIPKLIYNIRANVERSKRPKGILGSCDQHIKTGSAIMALGIYNGRCRWKIAGDCVMIRYDYIGVTRVDQGERMRR